MQATHKSVLFTQPAVSGSTNFHFSGSPPAMPTRKQHHNTSVRDLAPRNLGLNMGPFPRPVRTEQTSATVSERMCSLRPVRPSFPGPVHAISKYTSNPGVFSQTRYITPLESKIATGSFFPQLKGITSPILTNRTQARPEDVTHPGRSATLNIMRRTVDGPLSQATMMRPRPSKDQGRNAGLEG